MKYLNLILCFFGVHKWKYVDDNKIFPFTCYIYCERCGKIKITQNYNYGK